jgi:hypothetical protein
MWVIVYSPLGRVRMLTNKLPARQDNVDNLAHLAFWVFNSTLLLHLLRRDEALDLACHELNLFVMLEVRLCARSSPGKLS